MKLAVVLLSLMVMSLNAVPCCWDTCDETEVAGHTEEKPGADNSCSPFLGCGSCSGFILQQELSVFSSFTSPFRSLDEHEDQNFLSDYTTIIWAPPKEV